MIDSQNWVLTIKNSKVVLIMKILYWFCLLLVERFTGSENKFHFAAH